MSEVRSRITNVIETTEGEDVTYFTLEGVMIGGFKGGVRVKPKTPKLKEEKPAGSVVKPMSPADVQREHDREAEKLQTPEGRLDNLKKNVA